MSCCSGMEWVFGENPRIFVYYFLSICAFFVLLS